VPDVAVTVASERPERADPVMIGGVGGSGTRVVTAVLQSCGLHLAGPINDQLDSIWMTLMFERPGWLTALMGDERPVSALVHAARTIRSMYNGAQLPRGKLAVLAAAAAETATLGYDPDGPVRRWPPAVPFRFVADYLGTRHDPIPPGPWGWKAPVNQVVLPELLEAFPRARYIHVVHHPLDIAWSGNTRGAWQWGSLCGYDRDAVQRAPHNARLAWWLYTMEHTIAMAQGLRERVAWVSLEAICARPGALTRQLSTFAGLRPDAGVVRVAAAQVEPPASMGRWREHDLATLDPSLLERAQAWLPRWEGDKAADVELAPKGSSSRSP
jgi:hypothetical protein